MKKSNAVIWSMFATTLAFVIIFVFAAFLTRKAEWLNRGGAVVAATAAAFAFLQIHLDIKVEERRRRLVDDGPPRPNQYSPGPLGGLEMRIKGKKAERMAFYLTAERIRFAGAVALCACVGELLHGMGDLLLISLFPSYF